MVASQKTINQYTKKLAILKQKKLPIDGTLDVNTIVESLQTDYMSDSTIKVYLSAILWKQKTNKNISKKFISDLSKKITSINKKLQKKTKKNILSGKQKENFLSWNDILNIYTQVKSCKNNSFKNYQNYVLLSLYILFPPRRVSDYSMMKIIHDDKDLIHNELTDNYDEYNYYIYDKSLFVFNNYKTKTKFKNNVVKYKQQHFTISKTFNKILKDYIDGYNVNGSLLGLSDGALMMRLKSIFNHYSNKRISVNILRHSYITYKYQRGELDTVEQREKLASKMGHSIQLQLEYYKKN